MDAVDEAGGSGIALDSWAVLLDGAVQSAGKAAEEIPGGYRLRWTPAADWSEGGHTVAFTVSDRDGWQLGSLYRGHRAAGADAGAAGQPEGGGRRGDYGGGDRA